MDNEKIICPVCGRNNDITAITCANPECRRYLPQVQKNEYSLALFLKNNEALFTVLGVFLVLAFIFYNSQFTSFYNPQSSSSDFFQLNCSINGTEIITNNSLTNSQINCYGNNNINISANNDKNFKSNSARNFSFLCLEIAGIIYLVILMKLLSEIIQIIKKIAFYLSKYELRSENIIKDSSIFFILLPFILIAFWFAALLIEHYPEMIANAFLQTILMGYSIELIFLLGIMLYLDKELSGNKNKILISTLFYFGLAFGIIIIADVINIDVNTLLFMIPPFFLFILFFLIGIWRLEILTNLRDNIKDIFLS